MQVYLLLNNICNLKCDFCIRGKQDEQKVLDIHKLEKILKINNFSNFHFLLTGGEPTLHKDLPGIIELCKPYVKGISINTNGVDSEWIDALTDNDIHVQISVDGTKEYHNQLRGGMKNIYDSILKTIDKLNEKNIRYNISTTVNTANYENVKLLCKKMDSFKNMKYWKVSAMLPFGCADQNDVLPYDRWNELVDYLIDEAEVRLKIAKLFDFKLADKYLEKNPATNTLIGKNCGDVRRKIYVYPDFTVYPCTCLTDFPLGNLEDETLESVLTNEISKKFSEYSVCSESACYSCKYLSICNGGCIGMSYHFHGKLGMGDFRCPIVLKK